MSPYNLIALKHRTFNSFFVYGAIIFLLYFIYQLITPIRMGDTDMWFHLNGGRYFWENLSFPTTSFFSFIEPERHWTNYSWGFQATLYKIYEIAGYHSLIIFRALITTATLLLCFVFLKSSLNNSLKNDRQNRLFLPILFLIIGLLIMSYDLRAYQLRPHLFSYFFIILFLLILEFKPKAAPALPFLVIIWANTHGVEWPAGALILGSYALPLMIRVFRKKPLVSGEQPDRGKLYLISILLCAPAMMITPYGWEIYLAPFNVPADVYLYTHELSKPPLSHLTSISFIGLSIGQQTSLTLLFLTSVTLLVAGLFRKSLDLTHVLLFAGGIILLSKGARFIWEWLFLSIPMLASIFRYQFADNASINSNRVLPHIFTIAVLLLPVIALQEKTREFGLYPFDSRHLPVDVSRFLNEINNSGKIMTLPSKAGYTEWANYPNYKTFIDMQFPPFIPEDYFQLRNAYHSTTGFTAFLKQYEPDWILRPVDHTESRNIISRFKQFRIVFLDDVQVLYTDINKHPDIVEQFEIKSLNPDSLREENPENTEERIQELKRLLSIAPDIHRVNHALALLYFDNKNYEQALTQARHLIKIAPFDPNGYYLAAISLQKLEQFDQAIELFKQSLEHADNDFKKILYRDMGSTSYLKKDFTKAYDYFSRGINPYKESTNPEELYMFAFSAIMAVEIEEAKTLLEILLYTIDRESHTATFRNAEELLTRLNTGEFEIPSVFQWLRTLL